MGRKHATGSPSGRSNINLINAETQRHREARIYKPIVLEVHMNRIVPCALTVALLLVSSSLRADDATGTWKWTSTFNNNTVESTLKLKQDGDKLTGVYVGR